MHGPTCIFWANLRPFSLLRLTAASDKSDNSDTRALRLTAASESWNCATVSAATASVPWPSHLVHRTHSSAQLPAGATCLVLHAWLGMTRAHAVDAPDPPQCRTTNRTVTRAVVPTGAVCSTGYDPHCGWTAHMQSMWPASSATWTSQPSPDVHLRPAGSRGQGVQNDGKDGR
jgi:hypothetical protein